MTRDLATPPNERLRFPPGSVTDIDEIAIYIGQDSAEAAHRVVDEIYRAIQSLVYFPRRGHRQPGLTGRPLRFIRVRDYLIAYAPDENRCG